MPPPTPAESPRSRGTTIAALHCRGWIRHAVATAGKPAARLQLPQEQRVTEISGFRGRNELREITHRLARRMTPPLIGVDVTLGESQHGDGQADGREEHDDDKD